jgi:hypothetical protein
MTGCLAPLLVVCIHIGAFAHMLISALAFVSPLVNFPVLLTTEILDSSSTMAWVTKAEPVFPGGIMPRSITFGEFLEESLDQINFPFLDSGRRAVKLFLLHPLKSG